MQSVRSTNRPYTHLLWVGLCCFRVTCWSLWHCAPLYCVSNTLARCIFFFFCFGVDLFLSQVDNQTLAVCDISGCEDVDVPSGFSGGLVPVGGGGGVLPVCQSRPLSISVSVFSPLLFVRLGVDHWFFFLSFYVKIMFGFAFFLYMWLGLSLLPSSVEGAGNQPVKIVAFPVSMQNLFNYRKCCLKSLKASKSIFVLFIMYHIWIGVKY